MSFLLSSRLDLSLHRILGESPVILPTAVFADAKELVDRFGSPVDANATVLKDYVSIGLESEGRRERLGVMDSFKLEKDFLRGVRIYNGTDDIFVPDIDTYRTIKDLNRWPDGYSMFYLPNSLPYGDRSAWNERNIIPNMYLWRFAQRADLQNYTAKVRAFVDQAAVQGVEDLIHLTDEDAAFVSRIRSRDDAKPDTFFSREFLNGRAVEAMLFAGRNDWPQDFLTVYCHNGRCGANWSLTISPREPFLQIAVLENTSSQTAFPLSAVRLEEADTDNLLRPSDVNMRWAPTSQPFPPDTCCPARNLSFRCASTSDATGMKWNGSPIVTSLRSARRCMHSCTASRTQCRLKMGRAGLSSRKIRPRSCDPSSRKSRPPTHMDTSLG